LGKYRVQGLGLEFAIIRAGPFRLAIGARWLKLLKPGIAVAQPPSQHIFQLGIAEHEIEIALGIGSDRLVARSDICGQGLIVDVELGHQQMISHGGDLIDKLAPFTLLLWTGAGGRIISIDPDMRLDA